VGRVHFWFRVFHYKHLCMRTNGERIRVSWGRVLLSLLFVVPLGFGVKFYRGPGAWWFDDYAGGILYEVFWCLAAVLIRPKASGFRIACWVFSVTCFLEFSQMWHPSFLEAVRSTFLGRALIGTSFTWQDFPYYVIGCTVGWVWIGLLRKSESN